MRLHFSLQVLLCASVLTLTFDARSGKAHAQDSVWHNEKVYYSSNPLGCVVVKSELMLAGDQVRELADASIFANANCTGFPITQPAGKLAIRGVMWKWNGSTSVVCENFVNWTFNAAGQNTVVFDLKSFACGDGLYNYAAEGCAWTDNAWHCGTSFSGWIFADVNDNPPILQ